MIFGSRSDYLLVSLLFLILFIIIYNEVSTTFRRGGIMKRSKIAILAIIILISLTGCAKKGNINLYPAYELQDNKKIWGYINDKGKFKIDPKYDETFDFSEEGLAKVQAENYFGVVDTSGKEILTPKYQFVSDFENGYFYAFDGKYNYVFNYKGEEQFSTDEFMYIGTYSDGVFTVAEIGDDGEPIFGYLDKSGKTIIEPKFSEAWDFINGKALVKENDKYKFLNKEGSRLEELPYEMMAKIEGMDLYFFKENEKLGIVDGNGELKVQPIYGSMNPEVDNEIIIVNESENFGLIDINGNQILEMKYEDIKPLGKGQFAVKGNEKYALFKANGESKYITDFIYDNIGSNKVKINTDLVCAYDGESSYLIDLSGKKSANSPELKGNADIYYNGFVSRVLSNNKLSYYNSKGDIIWEGKNIYQLNENAQVIEDIFNGEDGLNIRYPVVEGLKDKSVEDSINKKLYKEFVEDIEDGKKYTYYNTNYTVRKINDLLTISSTSEYLSKDDSYPVMAGKVYNINLNKGTFFEFGDLFKEDSDYKRIISDMIRGQMEQKNSQGTGMYDYVQWDVNIDNVDFITNGNAIDIYFNPGEMISYTEQFPKFTILQEEIEDILDYKSEYWWAFMVKRGF